MGFSDVSMRLMRGSRNYTRNIFWMQLLVECFDCTERGYVSVTEES